VKPALSCSLCQAAADQSMARLNEITQCINGSVKD